MNDEELRDALRPPDGIEPLDPARVIAGAHRRRRRGVAAAGAAAVAVLAVVAGSVIATNGSSVVGPVGTPSSPRTTPRPSSSTPSVMAADLVACRTAIQGESPRPMATAGVQAILPAAEGTVFIIADGKNWAACDNGYGQNGEKEVSARRPGAIVKPGVGDVEAFAVAQNLMTKGGTEYEYIWAAGVLPDGVKTIRYTFADGTLEDAVAVGKYWLMHHWSRVDGGGATPAQAKIRVQLLGANGAVLDEQQLEPGLHTCAQISHGC